MGSSTGQKIRSKTVAPLPLEGSRFFVRFKVLLRGHYVGVVGVFPISRRASASRLASWYKVLDRVYTTLSGDESNVLVYIIYSKEVYISGYNR